MATATDDLRTAVRERYAQAAAVASEGRAACDCGGGECCEHVSEEGGYGAALYSETEREGLPETAVLASLGCGNPTAVADLREGEIVLDLGSGGGIDVILSAKRVGPTGTAYGLDMTDEMLALAQKNAREAGVSNVHFLKGVIEQIPLPANSVDVVISNCVINLSTDKPAVLAEIGRVLKPGGRLGISDIVAEDHLTPEDRAERGAWVGCIAGALSTSEYEAGLEAAGFEDVSVEFTYEAADGMHGAIVKGVKTSDPANKGLPVIQPATGAGCC
jgi:SAM-dependent methyltransferase